MSNHDDLDDADMRRVIHQVDHFIEILEKRYELHPREIVEAVKWVKERKSFAARLQMSSAISAIGIIVGAVLLAIWEGFKHLFARP